MSERASIRRANFFKGTMRDPDAHTTPDAAIDNALLVVGASIDAQAQADGRELSTVQRQRALSVAQRLLRSLPRDQLQNISAHSGLLKSIADQSLAVSPVTDPRAAAQARLDERGQGVGTGEPSTALLGRRGIDGGASSFARLAEMGGTSTEMARTIDQARYEAIKLGIPWAANNPDLLRLGAGAIKAIAATNLKETGYKALRDGSFYEAKDIVAFAKHSTLRGFDAEKAAHATKDLVQAQPADQQQPLADILKKFDHAAAASYANPADTAARQRLEEAGQRQKAALQAIAAQSAEQAERVRRLEESKKVEERFRATAAKLEVRATNTEAANRGDVAAETSMFDAPLASPPTTKRADAPASDPPTDDKQQAAKGPDDKTATIKTAEVRTDDKKVAAKGSAPVAPKMA
ncbi:MAG: hypothetical protein ABL901_20360 [Hyphomicrobiaceae bacterium]